MKHLEEFLAYPNFLINFIQRYDYYFWCSFLLDNSGFLEFSVIRVSLWDLSVSGLAVLAVVAWIRP